MTELTLSPGRGQSEKGAVLSLGECLQPLSSKFAPEATVKLLSLRK